MDYVSEDLKERNIQKLPGLVKRPRNKQKGSLEVSCESLIVGTADGREERRRRRHVLEALSELDCICWIYNVEYHYEQKIMPELSELSTVSSTHHQ